MKHIFNVIICIFLYSSLSAQPSADKIIKNYLETTSSGKPWPKLKSRISTEIYQVYSTSSQIEIVEMEIPYKKVYMAPYSQIRIWTMDGAWSSTCYTNNNAWVYDGNNKIIHFLDDDNLITNNKLPCITLLDILDYPVYGAVTEENDSYIIKFFEKKANRILSVYFNKQTGLISKHTYSNNGRDFQEYYYSNYKMVDGYMEPYLIERFFKEKRHVTINVDLIVYNENINTTIFKMPVQKKGRKMVALQNARSYPKIIKEKSK